MSLEFEDFIAQINYIIDVKSEENIMTRWINGYQNISLEEFKQHLGYKKPSEVIIYSKPLENILEDLACKFG